MARERRRSTRTAHEARVPAAPLRGARLAAWIVALLVLLTGILLRVTLPPVQARTPDEQTYATFAAGFQQVGFGRYAEVIRNFGADSSLAQMPPPTRVGFLWLAVPAMSLTGDSTARAITQMSLLASLLLLVAAVLAAGRWLGPGVACIVAVLLAASPMDLAIARRAWQDDVFALFGFGMAAALAWRAARGPRVALPASLLFFACAGYALLIKESALPLLLLGTAMLAAHALRDRGARAAMAPLAGAALTAAAVVLLLAWMCGGFDVLARTWTGLIRGQDTNDYVRKYQSGGLLYYATGLAILQPLAAALGALGTIVALARPRWIVPGKTAADEASRRALVTLAAWSLGFVIFTALWPLKSLRFLSPIFGPAAILGAAAVAAALRLVRERASAAAFRVAVGLTALVLALAAYEDLRRFFDFFIRRGIPDLATPWFTGLK